MRPLKKLVLIALGTLATLIVVAFGVFFWIMGHAEIDQSTGPVSREQGLSHCAGIPLPPSAHDVQYASYACGLQDGDFYVRFMASVPDCYATAETIFVEWIKTRPHDVRPTFQRVSHPAHESSRELRTDWFDNENISNGAQAGAGVGWEPHILIDEDRGIFYYHVTD
jgi:hypothetical protein